VRHINSLTLHEVKLDDMSIKIISNINYINKYSIFFFIISFVSSLQIEGKVDVMRH